MNGVRILNKPLIYLDNAASKPITNIVFAEMLPWLQNNYANPSSLHSMGREVRKAVDKAREQVAKAINADPTQVFFTSCGTESNNLVLSNFNNVLCSRVEHSSIHNHPNCAEMDSNSLRHQIYEGRYDLVTHMFANNEVGSIYDIKSMADISHQMGVLFHTDAVQAFGCCEIDVKYLDVDSLSLSGQKIYASKGVGVLYLKDPSKYKPLIYGGKGQEKGLRSGTENVPAIVGMGKACELYNYDKNEQDKIALLRDNFEQKIIQNVSDVLINAKDRPRVGNISSLSFKGIEGEALMLQLDHKGICVSSGSACNSGSLEPSHVLQAMGVPDDYIYGTIRVSLSRYTTQEEIDYAADCIIEIVNNLRCY